MESKDLQKLTKAQLIDKIILLEAEIKHLNEKLKELDELTDKQACLLKKNALGKKETITNYEPVEEIDSTERFIYSLEEWHED